MFGFSDPDPGHQLFENFNIYFCSFYDMALLFVWHCFDNFIVRHRGAVQRLRWGMGDENI